MPEFTLRFPSQELAALAARNAQIDDPAVQEAGRAARGRGFYHREEFLIVSQWKSRSVRPGREENDEATVRDVTSLAFSSSSERVRIEALLQLRGVTWSSASVLLHWGHPDPYPVLEPRVLWSVGIERNPRRFDFDFWWGYVRACRRYIEEAGIDARTLDRALWQYAREHFSARST